MIEATEAVTLEQEEIWRGWFCQNFNIRYTANGRFELKLYMVLDGVGLKHLVSIPNQLHQFAVE